MRNIQTKFDWFYEFRPYIILAFALMGIWSPSTPEGKLLFLSRACAVLLFYMSFQIMYWRHEYRKIRRY